VPRPHSHTPSNSERSGRPAAAAARSPSGRVRLSAAPATPLGSARRAAAAAGSRSRPFHGRGHGHGRCGTGSRLQPDVSRRPVQKPRPTQHPRQEPPRLSRPRKLLDGTADDDHQVVAGTQVRVQFPQCLARHPLQPVALHGTATLATGDDAIAVVGWIGGVGQIAKDQWTVGNGPPARSCRAHVAATPQPKSSFHAVRAVTARPPSSAPCGRARPAAARGPST